MDELNAKYLRAIYLLSQGYYASHVAEELKISQQTLCTWKKEPLFLANLNSIKMDTLEAARSTLQNAAEIAAETLEDLMQNSKNDSGLYEDSQHLTY